MSKSRTIQDGEDVFRALCQDLKMKYHLRGGRELSTEEQVAIFLQILGYVESNRMMQERFQHSGETISRHFHYVLEAVIALSMDIIKPLENFDTVHEHIRNNPKYWPYFKDCIGAIDGTHMKAILPVNEQVLYIGRKGYAIQNIIAACDFDMCFTFVWPGWEGRAHDTRIFYQAIRNLELNFPHPPRGKYYLVDAGYPNIKDYLAPYTGERKHFQEFQRGARPRNVEEMSNEAYSSLRSIIERTFGVQKSRWQILDSMHSYNFDVQVAIVIASMAIHNYIRKKAKEDLEYAQYVHQQNQNVTQVYDACVAPDEKKMDDFRDQLASEIIVRGGTRR